MAPARVARFENLIEMRRTKEYRFVRVRNELENDVRPIDLYGKVQGINQPNNWHNEKQRLKWLKWLYYGGN